jgi:hypothetical protein
LQVLLDLAAFGTKFTESAKLLLRQILKARLDASDRTAALLLIFLIKGGQTARRKKQNAAAPSNQGRIRYHS